MKKFKVTQYCSTHSEFDINNASSENPLKNYKATGNFHKVEVEANDEMEAIAKVAEQGLLPVIPEAVLEFIKKIWGAQEIYHIYFCKEDPNSTCYLLEDNDISRFVERTVLAATTEFLDSLEI